MASREDSVALHIFGAKSIIPEPIDARAELDWTWFKFLTEVCGLQITRPNSVVICTTSYSMTGSRGWKAELNDKIRDYVEKFTVKKEKYSARLGIGGYDVDQSPKLMKTISTAQPAKASDFNFVAPQPLQRSSSSHRLGPGSKPNHFSREPSPAPSPKPNQSSTFQRKVVGFPTVLSPMKRTRIMLPPPSATGGEEFVDEGDDDLMLDDIRKQFLSRGEVDLDCVDQIEPEYEGDDDECDDNFSMADDVMSTFTAATAKRAELKTAGVEISNLKPLVESRIKRFDNCFLLRVRHEIRRLRQKKLWDRNVQRSPLSCYLLQEIFKD